MALKDQEIGENFAIYCGDCMEVLPQLKAASVGLSIYSPPFGGPSGGLYTYSSDPRDLSNSNGYDLFMEHYGFVVAEVARVTMPGRMSLVHCMDTPKSNSGRGDGLTDFPGDIIRLHAKHGWDYAARYHVWKEPLTVRNRTMAKGLAHQTIVEDGTRCSVASADYLLAFRRHGENPVPVEHPTGLSTYAGERPIPSDLLGYKGWTGKQTENRLSHWIWRQYASAFWDDVRLDRVLPHKIGRNGRLEEEDERHVHPLQLDVIERGITLWSNPGEIVLTPFLGVGSEAYVAVELDRKAIGIELKEAYFRQAVKNLRSAGVRRPEQADLFDFHGPGDSTPDLVVG